MINKWKRKSNCIRAMAALGILLYLTGNSTVYASEWIERPLIQSTTLQGDYEALTALDLIKTCVIETENAEKAFPNILKSCVWINVNGYSGSGSIYRMTKDEIIIVSNKHLLMYWDENSYVTFYDGMVGQGTIAGVSAISDAGFVKVPIVGFTYEELLQYRAIRYEEERCEALEEGSAFFMADLSSGLRNPILYYGKILEPVMYIKDFDDNMIYGEAYAKHGMSGSGIFDGYGNYIGMLAGGTNKNEIAAVPAGIIYKLYDEIIKD